MASSSSSSTGVVAVDVVGASRKRPREDEDGENGARGVRTPHSPPKAEQEEEVRVYTSPLNAQKKRRVLESATATESSSARGSGENDAAHLSSGAPQSHPRTSDVAPPHSLPPRYVRSVVFLRRELARQLLAEACLLEKVEWDGTSHIAHSLSRSLALSLLSHSLSLIILRSSSPSGVYSFIGFVISLNVL